MSTLTDPFRYVDLSKVSNIEQLAIENVNGLNRLINQPKNKKHDDSTNEDILKVIESTLSDYRQDLEKQIHFFYSKDISLTTYESYMSSISNLLSNLNSNTRKIECLWSACKLIHNEQTKTIDKDSKIILESFESIRSKYSAEKKLASLLKENHPLADLFFQLSAAQKNALIQEIIHSTLNEGPSFKKFIEDIISAYLSQHRIVTPLQSLLVQINRTDVWNVLSSHKLITNASFDAPSVNLTEAIFAKMTALRAAGNPKDVNVFLDTCIKIFKEYKPEQLVHFLKKNSDISSLIKIFQANEEVFRGLVDLKYEGDFDSVKDSEAVLNVTRLAQKLQLKNPKYYLELLGKNGTIPSTEMKSAGPFLKSCVALLDAGYPPEKMNSFIKRYTTILKRTYDFVRNFPKATPTLIDAVLELGDFENLERSELNALLLSDKFKDLVEGIVPRDNNASRINKDIHDLYIKHPYIKNAFQEWLELYVNIHCSHDQIDGNFSQKLESLKDVQIEEINKLIKNIHQGDQQKNYVVLEALKMAKYYPTHFDTVFSVATNFKYIQEIPRLLINVSENLPALSIKLINSIKERPYCLNKFEKLYAVLERKNELDLLEPLYSLFVENLQPPDVFSLDEPDFINNLKTIIDLEKIYQCNLLSKGHYSPKIVKIIQNEDEDFVRNFIQLLNTLDRNFDLVANLENNPSVQRKLILMASQFPRAFVYLSLAAEDPETVKPFKIFEKFLYLYDNHFKPKLISQLLLLLESNQDQIIESLCSISEDKRITPSLGIEIMERITDQIGLRNFDETQKCLDVFKEDPNSLKSRVLLILLRNPAQFGLIKGFLKLEAADHPILFNRIATMTSCDQLSTAVLNLIYRGRKGFAHVLENSLESPIPSMQKVGHSYKTEGYTNKQMPNSVLDIKPAEIAEAAKKLSPSDLHPSTESEKVKRLYPLLLEGNYMRAESLYNSQIDSLNEPIFKWNSGKLQEQFLALFESQDQMIKEGILQLLTKLGTDEERTDLLGAIAYALKNDPDILPNFTSWSKFKNISEVKAAIFASTPPLKESLDTLSAKYSTYDYTKETALSVCIADFLLIPTGALNVSLIPVAREWLKSSNVDKLERHQISFVLDVLEKDQEMCLRVKDCPLPTSGSPLDKLVRQMRQIAPEKPLSQQDARIILLSGLLYPTRQSKIGSCFATSIVIQQDTYKLGIKQKLEDFLAFMKDSKITRTTWNNEQQVSLSMDFPVFVEDLLNEPLMNRDHLLSRAREFTISSMGGMYSLMSGGMEDHVRAIMVNYVNPILNLMGKEKEKEFQFVESLASEMRRRIGLAFLAGRKNPRPPHKLGCWNLTDRLSGNLVKSADHFQKLLIEVMTDFKLSLLKAFPNESSFLDKVFDSPEGLVMFTKSWTQKYLQGNLPADENLPWINYNQGANPFSVRQLYFEESSDSQQLSFRSNHKSQKS